MVEMMNMKKTNPNIISFILLLLDFSKLFYQMTCHKKMKFFITLAKYLTEVVSDLKLSSFVITNSKSRISFCLKSITYLLLLQCYSLVFFSKLATFHFSNPHFRFQLLEFNCDIPTFSPHNQTKCQLKERFFRHEMCLFFGFHIFL